MKDIKDSDCLVNWLIKPFLWNKERWSNQASKYWTPSQKKKFLSLIHRKTLPGL